MRVPSFGEDNFLYFHFLSSVADFLVRRATWDEGCLPGEVWGGSEGACVEGALPPRLTGPGCLSLCYPPAWGGLQLGPLCPGRGSRVPSREKENFSKWLRLSASGLRRELAPFKPVGSQHHFADCFLCPLPRGTGS